MPKRFLLADDHSIIRSGVSSFLHTLFPDAEIDEACDEKSILAQLAKNTYDIVLTDMQMPNSNAFGFLEYMHVKYPSTPVLIFTMNAERTFAVRALKAGAKGFLSKEAPLSEMEKAIRLILNNKKYVSEALAGILVEQTFSTSTVNPFDSLSSREFELTNLLLAGKTLSEITKLLNIQMSTASTHKARIFTKLGVTNLFELKELSNCYNL